MSSKGIFSGIVFIGAALTIATAADKPVSTSRTNAVTQLRNQDNAFALMMESYRQIQLLMIESDLDKRIQLAKTIVEPKERDRILDLAQQEYDQRIAKLQQTLKSFDGAYDTTRQDLQKKTGGVIVTKTSPEDAQEQLRRFRVFSPKEFRMENQPPHLMPAGAQMMYGDKRY
ncbi:MAG: hypothetical protein PCFJNLEI_00799 [Verrucomicrobiae bacterium]|nr:hypothetical protein [Verrucomicrobiae bacterium]